MTAEQYLSPIEERRELLRILHWRKTHLFGIAYHQCRYCGRGIQATGPPPEVCPKCGSTPQPGRAKLPERK